MFEASHCYEKIFYLGGCDEVGRGPLAGPVVACAVILEKLSGAHGNFLSAEVSEYMKYLKTLGVGDSKKVSHFRRKAIIESFLGEVNKLVLNKKITLFKNKSFSLSYSLAQKTNNYIDRVNILNASMDAMCSAIKKNIDNKNGSFGYPSQGTFLIDGNRVPQLKGPCPELIPVVKGDQKSVLIGLASIFAKEYRDLKMSKMARKYPGYGWEKNSGYPTKDHREALQKLGPTPYHRKTFGGVKEMLI